MTLFLRWSPRRRWFSIQNNQLVYQKKFKVCHVTPCLRPQSNVHVWLPAKGKSPSPTCFKQLCTQPHLFCVSFLIINSLIDLDARYSCNLQYIVSFSTFLWPVFLLFLGCALDALGVCCFMINMTKFPCFFSSQDNPTVVVEDLRLCTVKHCEDIERRFCFEVVSPTK